MKATSKPVSLVRVQFLANNNIIPFTLASTHTYTILKSFVHDVQHKMNNKTNSSPLHYIKTYEDFMINLLARRCSAQYAATSASAIARGYIPVDM